jgi:hypothetical protein
MTPFVLYCFSGAVTLLALAFCLWVRERFLADPDSPGEEISDYLHNRWIKDKNAICYGAKR